MSTLLLTRAKDRTAMMEIVRAILSGANDATIENDNEFSGPRALRISFKHAKGLAVTIELDADERLDREGSFCLAWHMNDGGFTDAGYEPGTAKLSETFGVYMQSSVNPHHRRKCTAFASGFEDLCAKLRKAVGLINSSEAYL